MKLATLFIAIFLTSAPYVYALKDINQQTKGPCSPAINDTTGSVTITCNDGISPQTVAQLVSQFIAAMGEYTKDVDHISILTNVINDYLLENKAHKQTIAQLTEVVSLKTERIKNILDDEFITKKVKKLIAVGKIAEAEQLVDSNARKLETKDRKHAALHYERGRVKELRVKYSQAKTSFEKAAVLQSENTTYLNAFASILHDLAEYDKAIGYYELALASDLATFGKDHPNVATTRNNLGSAWKALGEYDKAIGYYELALASGLATFGKDHPQVAIYRNNLGLAWQALGEYDKAIGYFELALASDLGTFGEAHPKVAIRRNNLGGAWYAKGEYDKAIGYFELALATMKKVFGDNHPSTQTVQRNLERAQNEQ